MAADVDELDRHFRAAVLTVPAADSAGVPDKLLGELFDAQATSRHVDFAARRLRAAGCGYYTIGSAGHEGNAAVAAALRWSDPALLHYRSGAFYLQRALQFGNAEGIRDILLGVVGGAAEPISGGRHKVFGNAAMNVIPLTSTVASHLPRAVGIAFAIERSRKLQVRPLWPGDAIVLCGFGDASVNHSTAAGAINTACQVTYQGLPLPVLFVCEDNGLGISVPTPPGWVRRACSGRLRYFAADGCDIDETYRVASAAASWVREHRRPAFLHLDLVRFLSHAGSDAEIAYRQPARIASDLTRDPLLSTAALLVGRGLLSRDEVLERYDAAAKRVAAVEREVAGAPQLPDAVQIVAPIAPRRPGRVAEMAGRIRSDRGAPLTLATTINRALAEGLATYPEMLVFGEDVARKGGVYGVTRGLAKRFGSARVFDTLLDEQAILGLALGTGISGLLPVPEIQYLAYLHNAEDQLRGEAATMQFFSQGQFRNPMVVRIASYAYQKGFGGHFHNDNSIAALRDIPGLVVASPSRPDDAAAMLRTCLAAAVVDGTVCAFLEPIALYHERDLYSEGDGGWLAPYPATGEQVPIGRVRVYGSGTDLVLATFGNGVPMSLRVARRLAADGIDARVVDLRWLAPLPMADLIEQANATGRITLVDETRRTGGVGEGILAELIDAGYGGRMARVSSMDSLIPLGDAARHVLLDEATIEQAARRILR